ncbi:MAG: copper chaperone PCu(A)C [Acidisphaera sp.]|nr:copper chaperone PCu(A)C [Acidisphaera sp.]
MHRPSYVGLVCLLVLLAAPALGRDFSVDGLRVSEPWSRATASAGGTAAGYMAITNTGRAPDRLIAAACPVAQGTELHSEMAEAGVMRMRPVQEIALPPGQTVRLAPDGLHLMLMGTKQKLTQGSSIGCTLTFEKAGRVDVTLAVGGPGATAPPGR